MELTDIFSNFAFPAAIVLLAFYLLIRAGKAIWPFIIGEVWPHIKGTQAQREQAHSEMAERRANEVRLFAEQAADQRLAFFDLMDKERAFRREESQAILSVLDGLRSNMMELKNANLEVIEKAKTTGKQE